LRLSAVNETRTPQDAVWQKEPAPVRSAIEYPVCPPCRRPP